MARCECAGCGERFGGVRAFDRHQRPEGTCHPPAERGLVQRPDGLWVERLMTRDAVSRVRVRAESGFQGSPGVKG